MDNDDIRVFEDSETLKIGLEETRKQILELLRVKGMSISQIAEALEKDQSTIYRHIKKLEEAGFIEVKGEKKEHHIPERIYGRTAEMFLLTPEPIESMEEEPPYGLFIDWNEERIKKCVEYLCESGFECRERKEEMIKELTTVLMQVDREVTEKILSSESLDKIDFFFVLQLKFLAMLITLENEDEFKDKIEIAASCFEMSSQLEH